MSARLQHAFLGSLIADAVAMPVHWYYNTMALDRDYGAIDGYLAPKNPHPDSILWRSTYKPRNAKGRILHDQSVYWGQKGIHYHQFLEAGENTINFLLAIQLYRSTIRAGSYDSDKWLELYVELMQTPGWHRDTYLEEYHRAFFDRLASGIPPARCGIDDIHIGGLTSVPALIAALDALDSDGAEPDENVIRDHVALTHRNQHVDRSVIAMVRILYSIGRGVDLRTAILEHGNHWVGRNQLEKIETMSDREIVGRHYSPACYLPESFAASLCLAWKYADDFSGGVLANARCGGDSCHRGVVVGSLLGAATAEIPEKWLRGLKSMDRLRCDTLDPIFLE